MPGSILLPLLLQTATPYGSPIPDILDPNEARDTVRPGAEQRFDRCVDLAVADPAAAIGQANQWLVSGGGFVARHCLGFAEAQRENWPAAEIAFTQAAQSAELAGDQRAAELWVQAGNAALASGDPATAVSHFNAALAQGTLVDMAAGLVHSDRARAYVLLEEYTLAREDFVKAHKLVPQDPLGWLLSATLARRQGELARAQADIEAAAELDPRNAAIALEAGNIAAAAGDYAGARLNWEQAVRLDSESMAGEAAAAHLETLAAMPEEGATADE